MYASLGIRQNSEHSGELIGTHQKLDRAARWLLMHQIPNALKHFPSVDEILYFEGSRGPDGLKRKSPGRDDPDYFIQPHANDGKLMKIMDNHRYNLTQALKAQDTVRASFEAAWLAHAIVDGLTPAHHYPYRRAVDELMCGKDYKKLFGIKVKGIMRGESLLQAARNNWLYWGAGGIMTKHIAYEYGVAYMIAPIPIKRIVPKGLKRKDFRNIDFEIEFIKTLERIDNLKMYDRFLEDGWTAELITETRNILVPEIVRMIAMAWASCIEEARSNEE